MAKGRELAARLECEGLLSGSPLRLAMRFFARHAACLVACWAVGGHGCQVFWSTTQAQSPSAHTPGWSSTSRNLLTTIRPLSFLHVSAATSGLGAAETVLTSVLVGIRSPPSRMADSAVAPARRVLRRISTPRL